MPAITKIRFTNIVYEQGAKRYTDVVFRFDGHNGAIVLENGGGKTVFIQAAIQAVLPHADVAGRKMRDTLSLENGPAHIAIEWLLAEKPRRRYAATCVSLFMSPAGLDSLRYVVEYGERDDYGVAELPFTKDSGGKRRVTEKGEIQEYYQSMQQRHPLTARLFDTIKSFHQYIEQQLHIIPSEWEAIVKINSNEGGIEAFFDECKTTSQLVDRLLIPTIEESMEGYRQGTFADLFQTQREGFKQYKELKEKIEENRRILAELHKYVQGYEKLHLRRTEYDGSRQKAKAQLQLGERLETEQLAEQERLRERMAGWQGRQTLWRQKEASRRISVERQQEGALETELLAVDGEQERLAGQLAEAKGRYYSLRYAEHRERLNEAEAALSYVRERMEQLEQSRDGSELQERWERNGGKLRFWYVREESRQRELLGQLLQAESELEQELQEASAGKNEADKEREQLVIREAGAAEARNGLQAQRQEIARRILSNVQSQSVEEELPVWLGEQQGLEEEYLLHQRSLTDGDRKRSQLQSAVREWSGERLQVADELTRQKEWHRRYEQEQAAVRQELGSLRSAWERLGPVQEKQSSLLSQLADEIGRREQQKLQLLHQERLAYRHVDDYGELPVFFADAAAARLVQQWRHQFSLLELGVEYAASTEAGSCGELWPVTLVTTEREKPLLQRKLAEAADQLSYPVRVLSTQEARELERGGLREGFGMEQTGSGGTASAGMWSEQASAGDWNDQASARSNDQASAERQRGTAAAFMWVEPSLWQPLQQPEQFAEWKRSVGDKAGEAAQARREKELELSRWYDARKRLQSFLGEYPLDRVQEQERLLAELRDRQLRLEEQLERAMGELEALERKKDELQQEIGLNQQRQQQLDNLVEQGLRYQRLGEQLSSVELEIQAVQESLLRAARQVEGWQRRLGALTEQHERRRDEYRGALDKLQRLLEEDLYNHVKDYLPEELSEEDSVSRLKEERRDLELERHRIMRDRAGLEKEQERQEAQRTAAAREMSLLKEEYPLLSADLELPSRPEVRQNEALKDCKSLEELLRRIGGEQYRKQGELQEQRAAVRLLTEQYGRDFPGETPLLFQVPLARVQEELAAERRMQDGERRELDRLQQAVEGRLADMAEVRQLWNRHEKIHALDDPRLAAAELTMEELSEASYRLLASGAAVIDQLERQAALITEEGKRVSMGKSRFREFCARQVKDVKLREMAERGVELKESYGELQEFRSMMETSILKANHIAELRMQTEDQKLEQYISHIQTHLKQIAAEIRDLPKKTRVRTETGSKEIYVFHVPEWEEQDGKERIRAHLEWMISQLDSPRYRSELGEEQFSAVRKDLEKWLDAKQLLQKVLQQATIRISCRKVTNDQQVTGATYSWEESNRWSGGEKWSKNMTLFLGLLNYVAEKRQHIQSHMKRHRTVLLDNPFGKASSDHVLSPVFYIAEQLGFQIIALTAHAEGKFLQDYFPVVYSCRLRAALGSSGKQIVDPQQSIQQAYFQDHAPESMERIGEVRQIELF